MGALLLLCWVSCACCWHTPQAAEIGLANRRDLQESLAAAKEGMMDALADVSELFLKTSNLERLRKKAIAAQKGVGEDEEEEEEEGGQGISACKRTFFNGVSLLLGTLLFLDFCML